MIQKIDPSPVCTSVKAAKLAAVDKPIPGDENLYLPKKLADKMHRPIKGVTK